MRSLDIVNSINELSSTKNINHDDIMYFIERNIKPVPSLIRCEINGKKTQYYKLTDEQYDELCGALKRNWDMKKYYNYHKHSYYSNVSTTDCVVSYDEYCKRSKELGHMWLSSCEHGGVFAWVETYNKSKEHEMKFISCGEFYFVPNRFEENNSNYHLILQAKTYNAMRELNYIMSEAYSTGFYYKARIDLELLRMLPKGEVFVTTACLGSFLRDYPKTKPILEELIEIFGKDNFFLEVQCHPIQKQVEYNKLMKQLSKEYGLKLVAGVDSHMIDDKDGTLRDYLLHSKGIIYEDEVGWINSYPSYETLKNNFLNQGIWTEEEVEEFIDNTLILTQTDEIKIDTKMKVPSAFPDKSREWKLAHLKELVFKRWDEYKHTVDQEKWKLYVDELIAEYSVIEETKMEDYFLLNYYIIKRGIELGGILTKSSRGSGASYLTNFMLGFTSIDRLKHKVPMLRERFMGKARIIDNNSAPDIDFDTWNREAFIQAQDELLGFNGNYFMTAYGTLGIKSAFKMLCRAKNISTEVADEISKLISAYENDKKHNDDAKIENYIKTEEYLQLIEDAKVYTGIIDSFSVSPCSFVLFNGDLRREFGLIRDKHENLMCCVTGVEAEKLGYLKNDLLIVKVVGMNDSLYKRVGMKQPSTEELVELVKNDDLVWDLYAKGYTQSLNQVESNDTTSKVMAFKPKSVEELCAFIAMIRPATASIYKSFEKREDFKYDIEELDNLLRGEYLSGSWMVYQEQIMLLLQHLSFPDNETYSIMKAISKKKDQVISNIKPRFEENLSKMIIRDILNKK